MDTVSVSTTLYFGPWYRRSPYFEATIRAGCTAFDIYNHTYLPAYYGDPVEEYWHLLEHVTLWDVGVERVIEVSGPDALAFTNLLTCRDLTRCAVGQGKYAPLLSAEGGIINDPVLLRVAADRFWLCLADSDAGRAGRARWAMRSSCKIRPAAASCGTRSWHPASGTRSARSPRARRAASRRGSSTTTPT